MHPSSVIMHSSEHFFLSICSERQLSAMKKRRNERSANYSKTELLEHFQILVVSVETRKVHCSLRVRSISDTSNKWRIWVLWESYAWWLIWRMNDWSRSFWFLEIGRVWRHGRRMFRALWRIRRPVIQRWTEETVWLELFCHLDDPASWSTSQWSVDDDGDEVEVILLDGVFVCQFAAPTEWTGEC